MPFVLNPVEKLHRTEIHKHQLSLFALQEGRWSFLFGGSECFSMVRAQLLWQISISDTAEETARFVQAEEACAGSSCVIIRWVLWRRGPGRRMFCGPRGGSPANGVGEAVAVPLLRGVLIAQSREGGTGVTYLCPTALGTRLHVSGSSESRLS